MDNKEILKLLPHEFASNEAEITAGSLSAQVLNKLRENSAELINILYRIDIAEDKLKKAFAAQIDTEIASAIANLVIERLLQKLETRRRYGSV